MPKTEHIVFGCLTLIFQALLGMENVLVPMPKTKDTPTA